MTLTRRATTHTRKNGALPRATAPGRARVAVAALVLMMAVATACTTTPDAATLPAAWPGEPLAKRPDSASDGQSPIQPQPTQSEAWALPAPELLTTDIVWQNGGQALDMALAGSHLLIGRGPTLAIVDVSESGALTEIGRSEVLPSMVGAIGVAGSRAVVGAGLTPVVVDISDPSDPSFVVAFEPHSRDIEAIATDGERAFVLSAAQGGTSIVRVYSIVGPEPNMVGEMEVPGSAIDLVYDAGRLFIVAGSESGETTPVEVWVVDVSGTSFPPVSALELPAPGVRYLDAAGNRLYISEGKRFSVVDVADIEHPTELGWMPVEDRPGPVLVEGNRALLIAGGALRTIDVSDPSRPRQIGFHPANSNTIAIDWNGETALVLAPHSGGNNADVSVFNAGTKGPEPVGAGLRLPSTSELMLEGDVLYVARDGLQIFDVSVPEAPREIGRYDTDGAVHGFTVHDGLALLMTEGLHVVDATSPSNPTRLAFLTEYTDRHGATSSVFGAPESYLAFDGTFAFVSSAVGAYLLDLSDPGKPVLQAQLPPAVGYPGVGQNLESPGAVALLDGFAAATFGRLAARRLATIDITPPTQPLIAGRLAAPADGSEVGMHCADELCYIGTEGAGLWIVDVTDPEDPVMLSSIPGRGFVDARGLDVRDGLAYLSLLPTHEGSALGDGGVRAVNVADPTEPREIGIYRTPGYALDVAVGDGYVYVADGPAGLLVLRSDD